MTSNQQSQNIIRSVVNNIFVIGRKFCTKCSVFFYSIAKFRQINNCIECFVLVCNLSWVGQPFCSLIYIKSNVNILQMAASKKKIQVL